MFKTIFLTTVAVAALSTPALAQDDDGFNGFYIGGSVGVSVQNNDIGSFIQFDRNRDGTFGDTVVTSAGADAFSPGFCNGFATSSTPGNCRNDKNGVEYAARIGGDVQRGHVVIGVVGEFGRPEINDAVSAFSTTPASYTMVRDVRYQASIRGRIGFTPEGRTLFYATGGPSYARTGNYFLTTNTANSFSTNGRQNDYGYQAGGGVEHRFGKHFSVGLEYLYNDFDDDKARVFVGQGTSPTTNPFVLGGGGTNFRRNDRAFLWHTGRATATFRF